MPRTLTLAVLVSGRGTTLEGLADRIDAGELPARIVLVVSDRAGTPAIARAERRRLPTRIVPRPSAASPEWTEALLGALEPARPDLLVLAGFLAVLPPGVLAPYRGRIITVHPSLLPRYGGHGMYGARVHRAVLDARETETGVTVHLVTEAVDAGPILVQERVAVLPGDTPDSLRARLHPVEVEALARAIGKFARGDWPLPYSAPESE